MLILAENLDKSRQLRKPTWKRYEKQAKGTVYGKLIDGQFISIGCEDAMQVWVGGQIVRFKK